MTYPGSWRNGLTHVQNISSGLVSSWEPSSHANPVDFPGRMSGIAQGSGNSAGWVDGGCAWEHCRRGSDPGPIGADPACPDPNLTAGNAYGRLTRTGVEITSLYSPPGPSTPGTYLWTQSFTTAAMRVTNTYLTETTVRRNNWIAPPATEWPEGVVGVEFDESDWELDLERIEVGGYGFEEFADPVVPVRPEMYVRANHPDVTAPTTGAWWPGNPLHKADPATIQNWVSGGKGQGPYEPGEAWEVDPSLFPYITQDGTQVDSHNLSFTVIPDRLRFTGTPWPSTTSGTAGGRLLQPTVRMHFRSARFRYLYDQPPPPEPTPGLSPLQQFPREDGLRSSSARQHYPRPRSQQASNQHYGGYF